MKKLSQILLLLFLFPSTGNTTSKCIDLFSKEQNRKKWTSFHSGDPIVLNGEVYSIFNHNSKTWDNKKTTKKATLKLNRLMKKHEIPVISMIERINGTKIAANHFLRKKEIDIAIQSKNGEHSLTFTGLKSLVLSGGYLAYCLACATREAIIGAIKSSDSLKLYVVTEATYVFSAVGPLDPINQAKFEATRDSRPNTFSLKEAMRFLNEENLVSFIKDSLIDYVDGELSIGRQYVYEKSISKNGLRLNFYNNGKLIESLGEGSKTIDLELVSISTLKKRIKENNL